MPDKIRQTDQEFAAACGLANDYKAGQVAIALRKRLAEYGRSENPRIDTESLCASTKIIDTGIIHPTDSIDLIDFTLQMEDLLGLGLNADDIQPLVSAGAEEMEIKRWIHIVLEIRERHNQAMQCTSLKLGH